MKQKKKLWEETKEVQEERMRKKQIRIAIFCPLGVIVSLFPFAVGLHFIFHTHTVSYGFITFPKLEFSVWWCMLGVAIVYAVVFYWRIVYWCFPYALKYLRENKKRLTSKNK